MKLNQFADILELNEEEAAFLGYQEDDFVQCTVTADALVIFRKSDTIPTLEDESIKTIHYPNC